MDTKPDPRNAQDAFLNAPTVATLTGLAIDDLEAQCLGESHRLSVVMTSWFEIDGEDDRYEVCSVCLGGAVLANRGWLDPGDQDSLREMNRRGADTMVSVLAPDILQRLTVLNEIRNLNVWDAVNGMLPPMSTARANKLRERCIEAEGVLKAMNVCAQSDPDTKRETGASYFEEDEELSPGEIEDSIRFFRTAVIPELEKLTV